LPVQKKFNCPTLFAYQCPGKSLNGHSILQVAMLKEERANLMSENEELYGKVKLLFHLIAKKLLNPSKINFCFQF